jgi:hypothetical protein
MVGMPSYNLSETTHNKWLQQSGNRGNDLFAATCDDRIRAVIQMINYRAYLKGKASGTGPTKQELKLRAARRSSDPKKIEEALSQLPGMEVATTRIPHLQGEEIFGSTKRKLDLPLRNDGDSHRPDKVNFSQPQVQTRSRTAHTKVAGASVAGADKNELPHVTTALESDCDMSGTLRGSPTDLVVNVMPSKQPPTSSALLGLPRAPKALLLQHTVEGIFNMVGPR